VWIVDDGALWPLTPFASAPAEDKVNVLARLLGDVFSDHPHLLRIVLTSHELNISPPVSDDQARQISGTATRRNLPNGTARDCVIVHRRLIAPAQFSLAEHLCADEPVWLDRALKPAPRPGRPRLPARSSTGLKPSRPDHLVAGRRRPSAISRRPA